MKLQKIIGIATLDFETLQLCTNVANRLTVNLRFYEKFSDIWESFGIKDKSLNLACAQQIKKLTWLIYIVAKKKVLGPNRIVEDLTENIFLMYTVIIRLLNLLPDEVVSEYLVKEQSTKGIKEAIQENLLKRLNVPPEQEQLPVTKQLFEEFLLKVSRMA